MERAGNPNLVEDLVSVGRRGERLLPTDLTDRLLPRDGIADDAHSVGAVVAVGAADVSHTLLAGVLPLPRHPPALARHAVAAHDPSTALRADAPAVCDTMAAVGPAKALHHGLALAQEGLAANSDPGSGSGSDSGSGSGSGSGSNLPSRRASGPAGCCWGSSRRRGKTGPGVVPTCSATSTRCWPKAARNLPLQR